MDPAPETPAPARLLRPRRGLAAGLAFALLSLAAPARAQQARPDQVLARDERTGNTQSYTGTVTENKLGGVVVELRDGSKKKVAAHLVESVTLGDVPETYREGLALLERGDAQNAAAKLKLAAGDEEARPVVRAAARLRAAEALLIHGARDPSVYPDADAAATLFIEDHAENREVPRARFVRAKAQLLAGNTAKAAEEFRSLYRDVAGSTPTPGYTLAGCYAAGLRAADAYLMQKETLAAREIYQSIQASLPGAIAGLGEGSPETAKLQLLLVEARLGEGFVLLQSGSASQARAFFEEQLSAAGTNAAQRYGARLGLGCTGLAEEQWRRAQVELAAVSAVDYTDPERPARALVGLAEAALNLPDSDARNHARVWIEAVLQNHPESIWVRRAHELEAKIQ